MRWRRCFPLLAMALRVIALALPVIVVFGSTALGGAALVAWINDTPLSRADNLCLGILCGLLVWLFAAAIHIRWECICLPVRDREMWIATLIEQLHDLGYRAERRRDNTLVFEPRFQALLFGGVIRVRLRLDAAIITGPRMYLELLRQRLRMETYLAKEQKALHDSRVLRLERRVRQVEIAVQVPHEHWLDVHAAVLAPLAREGADVVCHVHVLARGPAGIRETLIDGPIRRAFQRRGLHADIDKQPLSAPELCLA